ncbi:MAG TPA: hypothetical protein VH913_04445 [Hyphomicrobiaceae bacterium]|jgi:hypothetical protein
MRRPLLAGCLIVALAGVASGQSEQQLDETLPPASIIPPAAKPDASVKPDASAKPDAAAKPDASAKPDAAAKPDAKKADSGADYLAQCLRDWDAATHMTRQEWARTCRRVVSNRVKFLSGQQGK